MRGVIGVGPCRVRGVGEHARGLRGDIGGRVVAQVEAREGDRRSVLDRLGVQAPSVGLIGPVPGQVRLGVGSGEESASVGLACTRAVVGVGRHAGRRERVVDRGDLAGGVVGEQVVPAASTIELSSAVALS